MPIDLSCPCRQMGLREIWGRMMRSWVLGGVWLLLMLSTAAAQPPLRVAAAASLKPALNALSAAYVAAHPQAAAPEFVYGASAILARQIQQGAPFHLFLSADEAQVNRLHQAGLTSDAGVIYAIGRLSLISCTGLPVAGGLADVATALRNGQIKRFAIANPSHAPYGLAAQQTLMGAGLWSAVQPLLVVGENIAQAAQFVQSGNATMGIVSASLTAEPALQPPACQTQLLPADGHSPLTQRMVLIGTASPAAQAFYDYLQGAEARKIMVAFGYSPPEN